MAGGRIMDHKSSHRHCGCIERFLALAFAILFVLSTLPAAADDTTMSGASDLNLIITADSPRIRIKGKFEPIRAYLSRSSAPLKSAAPGPASAVLSDFVRTPGYYRVYAWWPQNLEGVGQAETVIRHLRGETTVVVDQRETGGQWTALGVYELGFGTRAEIEVRAHRGALVIDAFRFEFMGHDQPELTIGTCRSPAGSGWQCVPCSNRSGGYSAVSLVACWRGVAQRACAEHNRGRNPGYSQCRWTIRLHTASGGRARKTLQLATCQSRFSNLAGRCLLLRP